MSESSNILALLSSTNSDDIREGARLAGKARLQEAIPSLVNHISSSHIGVQEAADRALRKIGGAEVVTAVIPLLRSDDAPQRNISMDILRNQGGTNVDSIIGLLRDDDPDVRIFASDILGSVDNSLAVPALGRALLHDPEVNVRYQAAVSLGSLGSHEAAIFLNKALNDEEWVQFSVIEALTKIRDESSVNAMISALERSTDLIASTIVDALGEMGNIKAVPLLLKRLDASPSALCNKIIRAIINILGDRSLSLLGGKDTERMRGYMESAIEDEDTDVQDAAVKGLAAMGGDNSTRLIVELAATINPDRHTERLLFMVEALVRIGFNDQLVTFMHNNEGATRWVALEALGRIQDRRVAPLLKNEFWKSQRDAQRTIITFLSQQAGCEEQDFFMDILDRHTDGNVLRTALAFLGRNGNPDQVDEKVLDMLAHPYNDVKESAMEACVVLNTPKIQEHFATITDDGDPINRLMAVYSLGQMDPVRFLPQIEKSLQDLEPMVRKAAVESLGRLKPISENRLTLIEKAMQDTNREVRMTAVDILGTCPSQRIEDMLIAGLQDEDPWVKVRCVDQLGNRLSEKSVEHLVHLLADGNNLVVLGAVTALGKIGGESAFRSLLTLMDHADPEIQEAAEQAVAAISNKAGE